MKNQFKDTIFIWVIVLYSSDKNRVLKNEIDRKKGGLK